MSWRVKWRVKWRVNLKTEKNLLLKLSSKVV